MVLIIILRLLTIGILPIFVRKDTHDSVTPDPFSGGRFFSLPLLPALDNPAFVLLRAALVKEARPPPS